MKVLFTLIIIILTYTVGMSNAAAPGFWDAGGIGRCSLLYPEDSLLYKEIQMVKEKISIDLYKGFAVVKGEYWMVNHSKEEIQVKVGYPVNTDYDKWTKDGRKINILLRSLHNLKVYSNTTNQKLISQPLEIHEESWEYNNWFIWENKFAPKDTTLIEVFFIVNTNETTISEGYDRDETNGLIYILESGATWKQPIINGEIRIRLKDNLDLDDIKGITPDSIFKVGEGIIITSFNNLTPSSRDNIIIAYTNRTENFNIEEILRNEIELYKSVETLASINLSGIKLNKYKFKNPFEVNSWFGGALVGIAMLLYFLGIPLLIIVGLIVIIIFILKRNKKSKNVA